MIENKKIFYIRNKLHCVYYYEKRAHILGAPVVRLLGKRAQKEKTGGVLQMRFSLVFARKRCLYLKNVQIKYLLRKSHALLSSWNRASA